MEALAQAFSQADAGGGVIPASSVRSVLARAGQGGALPEELLGGLEASGGALTLEQLVQLLNGAFEASGGGAGDNLDAFLDAAGPQLAHTQQGLQQHPGGGGGGGGGGGSGAPLDESADARVVDFIATLAEYQGQCEQGGNYEEAARCTDQLRRLRAQEEARRIQALKSRHVAERTSVSAAQVAQFREFNASWDAYLSEYDAMATLYIKQLQAKHLKKLRSHQEELHAELVHKPVKFGREVSAPPLCAAWPLQGALLVTQLPDAHTTARARSLPPPLPAPPNQVLDWRAKEANLVKHHKYSEAARIKAVVEELERRERARMDEERLVVFTQREARYRLLQKAELTALQKRIETRRAGAWR